MSDYFDIVIAGGGMVGVSLALQLGAVLPAATTILLVEGVPIPAALDGGVPDYHPAFDARSTALSYSSRQIYEAMGVWEDLRQWLCAIESIMSLVVVGLAALFYRPAITIGPLWGMWWRMPGSATR